VAGGIQLSVVWKEKGKWKMKRHPELVSGSHNIMGCRSKLSMTGQWECRGN